MKTFWIRDANRNPVACVATEVGYWALAVHRPGDRFNRQLGREWAEGRLRAYRSDRPGVRDKLWYNEGYVGEYSESEGKLGLLSQVACLTMIPRRVREAAIHMIKTWEAREPRP